jgi:serine protease Do
VEPADVEISAELREVLGIEEGEGVRIERVVDESPAAKAGLERNDLILRIDGRKIASSTALGDSIARSAAGQTISIALVRKGKRESVNVTLASRPR